MLQLVDALLAEALELLSPPQQDAYLRRLAARLAGPIPHAANPSQRLVNAVQRLNQLGYRARWEARSAGPRLILEQRPFASLEPQQPELATLETYLIEALLGVSGSSINLVRTYPPEV